MTTVDESIGEWPDYHCDACHCQQANLKLYDHHGVTVSAGTLSKKVSEHHDFPEYLFKGGVTVCQHCGYGKMLTPPSEAKLEAYYKALFWRQREVRVKNASDGRVSTSHQLRSKRQIDMVCKVKPLSELTKTLEIGAGEAFASQYLKSLAPHLITKLCEAGNQWENHYVERGLERIADYFPFEGSQKFDLIIASHWLEHVLDISSVLKEIRTKLTTKGLLVIDVPNTAFHYWDLPERDIPHIHFFTPESLVKLCHQNGLECVVCEPYGITFAERQFGKIIQPSDFDVNPKGYGIRALFSVKQ